MSGIGAYDDKHKTMILRRAYDGDLGYIQSLSKTDFQKNVDNILFGASYGLYADTPEAREQYIQIVKMAIPHTTLQNICNSAIKAATGGQFEIVKILTEAGANNYSEILYWVDHEYESDKEAYANENLKERAAKSTSAEERRKIRDFAFSKGGRLQPQW